MSNVYLSAYCMFIGSLCATLLACRHCLRQLTCRVGGRSCSVGTSLRDLLVLISPEVCEESTTAIHTTAPQRNDWSRDVHAYHGYSHGKWLLVLSCTQTCIEEPNKTEIALSESTDKRTRVNKCCDMFLYKFECLEEVAHAPKRPLLSMESS